MSNGPVEVFQPLHQFADDRLDRRIAGPDRGLRALDVEFALRHQVADVAGHAAHIQRCAGWNSSTRLPDGSTSRTCEPPGPVTMSLRNFAPAARSRATSAGRSSTMR